MVLLAEISSTELVTIICAIIPLFLAPFALWYGTRIHKDEYIEYLDIYKPLNVFMFALFAIILLLGFSGEQFSPWFGIICFLIWAFIAYYRNKKQSDEKPLALTFIQASVGVVCGMYLLILIVGIIFLLFISNNKKK